MATTPKGRHLLGRTRPQNSFQDETKLRRGGKKIRREGSAAHSWEGVKRDVRTVKKRTLPSEVLFGTEEENRFESREMTRKKRKGEKRSKSDWPRGGARGLLKHSYWVKDPREKRHVGKP